MDNNPSEKETLLARINQLERERDDLQKDIEQLCIQQAGPSYVAVATRMHFQRTALLEQEIESLRKQLATSTRESQNLQEELTEAYRIKTQLADLHRAEAEKNTEAEKQVKFYQGCMAAAFAERDQSIMEAEKAKEQQELISQKFSGMEKRVDELNSDYLEQKRLNEELRIKLAKQENLNETFQKVINKFIEIRQQNIEGFEDASWDEKCACLLDDPAEMWSYNDASVVKYISALESELETVRNSADNLRSKLRVGLEIENHLKRRVQDLEMKQILLSKMILNRISELHNYHSQHRAEIVSLLDEGRLQLKSAICMLESEVGHSDVQRVQDVGAQVDFNEDESECRDVHVNEDHSLESKTSDHKLPYSVVDGEDRPSEALALALQEKVATLLLLSQQEERHLLDRNVNVALQRKIEDLQRDLLQVTNEKVKVLMEFAQLKQEYQQLREQMGQDGKRETSLADTGIRRVFNNDSDGRLKNILKKTYLKRWVGFSEVYENKAEPHLHIEENSSRRRSNDLDLARMKIENATLKESLESMEHLTSSIHRLRLMLLKVKNSVTTEDTTMGINTLNDIVYEANLLKTALGSSLPLSWLADMDEASITGQLSSDTNVVYKNPSSETVDPISAAGFEMVELIILAAQMLKDTGTHNGSSEAAD